MTNLNIARPVKTAILLAVVLTVAAAASAQGFPRGPRYASVAESVTPASLSPGAHGVLTITVDISPNFHINSAHPKDPDLIATAFESSLTKGVRFAAPIFPADQNVTTATGVIPAYTGKVAIKIPFTVSKSAHAGHLSVSGFLTYQGCNATSCYPPKRDKIATSVVVK
jgi:hypothetical protein